MAQALSNASHSGGGHFPRFGLNLDSLQPLATGG
jgi:hypothetical protein